MCLGVRYDDRKRYHVSLVAIPDAMASTLSGIYDTLNLFRAARQLR